MTSISRQVLNMESRQIAQEIVNEVRERIKKDMLEYGVNKMIRKIQD